MCERRFHLILVDSDPLVAVEIRNQLALFGYAVTHAPSSGDLQRLLPSIQPAALLIDMQRLAAASESANTLSILTSATPERPVIFLSIATDLPTRLRALRAGGKAYFHGCLPFRAGSPAALALGGTPPALARFSG